MNSKRKTIIAGTVAVLSAASIAMISITSASVGASTEPIVTEIDDSEKEVSEAPDMEIEDEASDDTGGEVDDDADESLDVENEDTESEELDAEIDDDSEESDSGTDDDSEESDTEVDDYDHEGPDVAIEGDALEKASQAALEYTGQGRVTDTEIDDEESYYEVEVTLDDGSEVDIQLDRQFNFVSTD